MKTNTNLTTTKKTNSSERLGSESDKQFLPTGKGTSEQRREPRSFRADRPKIDWQQRSKNRNLPTRALLDLMKAEAPKLFAVAQIVGKWVWVQFAERQAPEVTAVLAQLGFHWNNKRQVWQHPCGPVGVDVSPEDPRAKYGAEPARNLVPA